MAIQSVLLGIRESRVLVNNDNDRFDNQTILDDNYMEKEGRNIS